MDKKFDTYFEAADFLADSINRRKKDLSQKHIILTPEKYTLFFERLLLKQAAGFFDVQVFSTARLCQRLGGGSFLGKEGAIIALRSILEETELVCFARSKSYRGFCERLYNAIHGFYSAGISPKEVLEKGEKSVGALALKLKDIAAVYERFLEFSNKAMSGEAGTAEILKQRLIETDFLKNTHVYAANFDFLPSAEEDLFEFIKDNALSFCRVAIAENGQIPPITAQTEVYAAASAADALKAAARRIREAKMQGTGFEDMAVAASQSTIARAKRIFAEYGIPFFASSQKKLRNHPLAAYFCALIRMKNPRRADFIELSKNPFAGISPKDAHVFENYVNRFLIDYNGFSRSFALVDSRGDEARERATLATAEKVRKTLFTLAAGLLEALSGCDSASVFCARLAAAVEKVSGGEGDIDFGPAKNKLLALAALIGETLPDAKHDFRFLCGLFLEAVEAANLGSLPRTADCVLLGEPSVFRGAKYKYVFVLDFNEGEMPPVDIGSGLFSQAEALGLDRAGLEIRPSQEQRKAAGSREIYQLLAAAGKLFISYVRNEDSRPSPMLYDVFEELNKRKIKPLIGGFDIEQECLPSASNDELARFVSVRQGGLEYLLLTASSPTPLSTALNQILKDEAKAFLQKKEYKPAHGNALFNSYKENKTISASQLQSYFDCPYKHFIRHGLKAKKTETGSVEAADTGIIIHRAAQGFVESGLNESKLKEIIEAALDHYKYRLKENERLREKLRAEIEKLCLILSKLLKASDFSPIGAELSLLRSHLKPVDLGGVLLTGSIDYCDNYEGLARVVDYKSGYAKFEVPELYFGLKLQLPLYMQALIENGYSPAAMLYFPFRARWDGDYRFTGAFAADPLAVKAMDRDFESESTVLSAKLTVSKKSERITGSGAKPFEKMLELCEYSKEVSRLAAKQIQDGNIEPRPYRKGYSSSCFYCAYSAACGFNGEVRELKGGKI